MSLHQISESERQRARTYRELRSRLEYVAVKKIVVPPPVFSPPAAERLFDRNCLAYFNACCEGVPRPRVTVELIIAEVCKRYAIPKIEFFSQRRFASVVRVRQIAAWLAKTLTKRSYPDIGKRMQRDHSTCLHSVRKIEALRLADPDLNAELDVLCVAIAGVRHD